MVLLFCPHDGDGFEAWGTIHRFFFDRNLKTSPASRVHQLLVAVRTGDPGQSEPVSAGGAQPAPDAPVQRSDDVERVEAAGLRLGKRRTDAFWSDVLTSAYHGYTDGYATVNGSFGVKWQGGTVTTTVKVTNLFNQTVQQHIFGDLLRRTVVGEMKFRF